MKIATVLCATAVLLLQVLFASAAGGERQQQLPLFFQASRPFNAPGAPLPKFVGVGGGQQPQAFRSLPPPQVDEELDDEEQRSDEDPQQRNVLVPTPLPFRPQPTPQFSQFRASPSPSPQTLQPIRINRPTQDTPIRRPPPPPQSQFKTLSSQPLSGEQQELEEEKEEEPDRLTQLLPQSKFTCGGKKTGYYADEGLECEVFHYCQDGAKHSWICPEGFVFHQVNLICMPAGSENICTQSTQYHFVNDFLYRPLNMEEANSRPNVTLRYGDRYYPGSSFEAEEEYDRDEEAPQQRPQPQQFRQQPVLRQRIQQQPSQQLQVVSSTQRPLVLQQQPQPQQFARQPLPNQVFHSSEEINIPLQQRRPVPQQQQQHQQQQHQQQQQQQQQPQQQRPNFQQQQQNDFDFQRK